MHENYIYMSKTSNKDNRGSGTFIINTVKKGITNEKQVDKRI